MVVPPRTNHPASNRTMTQANQSGHNGRPIKLEPFADGGQIPAFLCPRSRGSAPCSQMVVGTTAVGTANGSRRHSVAVTPPIAEWSVVASAWWASVPRASK
jgi:hypothetical protein